MYRHPRILPSVPKQDSPSDEKCQTGWDSCATIPNYCYLVTEKHKSWEEAKVDCEDRGAKMVTIDSSEENDCVKEIMIAQGRSSPWIGMKTAFNWYDFSKSTYRNWAEDEPKARDLCVFMNGKGESPGLWHTDRCVLPAGIPFICKMSSNS